MFLTLLQVSYAQENSVLIENIRILDHKGDLGVHDILITGDRISGWDSETIPTNVTRIDGHQKTLIPGLIDSHIHIAKTPGSQFIENPQESEESKRKKHLRSYLAWGVTTVLDPGISATDIADIRHLEESTPAPDIQILGPIIGPKNGYPSIIFPDLFGVSKPEELPQLFDSYARFEPKGVKVTFEDGPIVQIWPQLDLSIKNRIQIEANQRELPIFVHTMDEEMAKESLKIEPYALVHTPFDIKDEALIKKLGDSKIYMISTLSVIGHALLAVDPSPLDISKVKETISNDEWNNIFSPKTKENMVHAGLELYWPSLPKWLYYPVGEMMWYTLESRMNEAQHSVKVLVDSGVTLVLGSDAGGSPITPPYVHGYSTHYEIGLLVKAGISPQQILNAATINPARMLRLDAEIGSIEVGKRADLVIVDDNPLANLNTLQTPAWVIRNGVARTPKEWMSEGK